LVLPSVTAFQMGGPNQMFRLFKEYVEEEKRRKEQQDMAAIADAPERQRISISNGTQAALRDVAAADDEGNVDEEDEGHAGALRTNTEMRMLSDENDAAGDDGPAEEAEDVPPVGAKKAADYYFAGHDKGTPEDYEFLSKIRIAESSLMLLKRQIYVDQIKDLAKTRSAEAKAEGKTVPKKIEKYLKEEFTVQTFKGNVHITDLDVFFAMFVMTAKSLSATCPMLFNKFTPGNDSDAESLMDRKAWDHFCARVPVKLPEGFGSSMFKLLTQGADSESASADIHHFIAAMHIHDISSQLHERDPFVMRIAQVLKLKYYSMSMSDFETKIRTRGHDTSNALECVDFPSDDDSADDEVPMVDEENMDSGVEDTDLVLPSREGDRFMASAAQEALLKSQGSKASQNASKKRPKISMTEAQYCQIVNAAEAEDTEDAHDTGFVELSSSELSRSDSSNESFDADDCLEEIEKIEAEQLLSAQTVSAGKQQFTVKTGDDLAELMRLPPKDFATPAEEATAAKKRGSSKKQGKKRQDCQRQGKEATETVGRYGYVARFTVWDKCHDSAPCHPRCLSESTIQRLRRAC